MDYISLIANTGIQISDFKISLNPEEFRKSKFYYYEGIDTKTMEFWFEELIEIRSIGKFIRKSDLLDLRIARTELNDYEKIDKIENSDKYLFIEGEQRTFSIRNTERTLKSLEKCWIPVPYFKNNQINSNLFGPTDWVRIWFEYNQDRQEMHLAVAVDTSISKETNQNHSPVLSTNPNENKYTLCENEDLIMSFMNSITNCDWVERWLRSFFNIDSNSSKTHHLATYFHLLRILRATNDMPQIQILTDQTEIIDLDLAIDVGNSQTCAILFETPIEGEINFNKVKKLRLRDLNYPIKTYSDSFSTRIVFKDETFGMKDHFFSKQDKFHWPSPVRIGFEAEQMIHNYAISRNMHHENKTFYSSPKRYLWDDKSSKFPWKFYDNETENPRDVYKRGISEQIKSDGSLCREGTFGPIPLYSRKTLMTFLFLEIFSQAVAQFNSFEFRSTHGRPSARRRLRNVVITCPTGMVKLEQIALRQCAQDAATLLKNYESKIYNDNALISPVLSDKFDIFPSVSSLRKNLDDLEEKVDWIYDEATCSQLVFLYGLIQHKFDGNAIDLFRLFGHKSHEGKQVLTIGSLDIGGGTSDLMICEYHVTNRELTPSPLYHESFNIAGDDLMKNIIQQIIIEGAEIADDYLCTGVIENYGRQVIGAEIREKLNGYFGKDAAVMGFLTRMMRVNFLNQIGVPIAHKFMEIANQNERKIVTYDEIFPDQKPSKDLLDHFHNHFGFRFEELTWNLNPDKVNRIIHATFSKLISQVAKLMHLYRCDYVIISGRPCSFKEIERLFIEIQPVQPNRFINLNNYWIGKWYPFSDNNGYVQDPKTIVATGALIGLMGTKFFKLNKLKINPELLKSRLISTANYLGTIKENVVNESFISPKINKASIQVYSLPHRIGIKHINSTNYPSRYLFQIEYNENYLSTVARSKSITKKESEADAFQNVINEKNAELPYRITLYREFDVDKEKIEIEEVINESGDNPSPSLFTIKTITLPNDNGYWFDTAEFTLSINSKN